jgi:hypothetical protein
MRRLVGVAMMVDGVLQAMGVAGLLSTIADRSLRDQALFAAHIVVGAGLVFAGRTLLSSEYVGPSLSSAVRGGAKAPPYVLIAALLLSLIETTWFNWIDVVMRAVYTVVALAIVLRKTTLPTT